MIGLNFVPDFIPPAHSKAGSLTTAGGSVLDVNRPGIAGGLLVKLSCHFGVVHHGIVVFFGLGRRDVAMGSKRRLRLSQLTHSTVANSTASNDR